MRRLLYALGAVGCAATRAEAHGFGQRYDLPIPLWLYIGAAALTVTISCAMLALFVRAAPQGRAGASIDLLRFRAGRALAAPPCLATLRLIAVLLYLLVVVAGFFGNQNPFRNLAPIAVWAAWWVGMAYVSALVGDAWKIANPLETIFVFAERLYERWRPQRRLSRAARLPPWVQVWPSVVLFLAFLWMEMVWEENDHRSEERRVGKECRL